MKLSTFVLIALMPGAAGLWAQNIELVEPVMLKPGEAGIRQDRIESRQGLPADREALAYLWAVDPETALERYSPSRTYAAAAAPDAREVTIDVRNNKFFVESVRLKNQAKSSFEEGDYDGSRTYAEESQRYAVLSDQFVANELKRREALKAISRARNRISWAVTRGMDKQYPSQYNSARDSYIEALAFRDKEEWDPSIAAANRVLLVLSDNIETLPLPGQYTVRTWLTERDCLWNIAGYPWVYGDPHQWKRLYEANKSKLPEPDNPDLVHPGTVLTIPVIRGEIRSGVWQPGRSYTPLPLR
jgi:nucleoid-associated protein YgaU